MTDKKPFDFASFVSANAERSVSGFDYLHIIYKTQGLTSDFILWIAKLFWPEFKIVDGMVFISELFDTEHYQTLLKGGRSSPDAQFWSNLLEITGLFDDLSSDQAMSFAESLVESWNAKLHQEIDFPLTIARAIFDEETGEVFVTIDVLDQSRGQTS